MNQYIIEQNFIESVENKFHFLNSVFLGIATDNESGKIISDFTRHVEKCLEKGIHPGEIMSSFFPEGTGEKETTDRLFDIIKFIERQVVIFDAIEDAAFEKINNLQGPNSLQYVIADAVAGGLSGDITDRMKNARVRVVLTAHPTQFYPGTILGIITDLNQAIRCNDLSQMSALLAQLSFTPFFSKTKPTPFDEALSLIWFLENVFYEAILKIHEIVSGNLPDQGSDLVNPKLIELGFWPGGDRDGNPFVTAGTTRMVANRLRSSILQKYHEEVRRLKRRLTFRPVFERLKKIESELYRSIYSEEKPLISERELLEELERIKELQKNKYHGLFVRETQNLINHHTHIPVPLRHHRHPAGQLDPPRCGTRHTGIPGAPR
jgi:phosphoenolpyruvate carboxylase